MTGPPKMEHNNTSRCDDNSTKFARNECDLVSDNLRLLSLVLNFIFIVQILDLFGTGTNIVNIVCFVKQGLGDPVNIALLGLAVSDLASMATLIWQNICTIPLFYQSDLPFDALTIVILTAGIPHMAFTRVTCCLTAFISLERCLCVVRPLKVQLVFSAKRVTIIVLFIYIVMLSGNMGSFFYTARFVTLPHPHKTNSTWLTIAYTEDVDIFEKYSSAINNCFTPFSTFTIISVSTVVLADALRRKAKWRKISTAPVISDSLSRRDKSLSKMVLLISTMFVICYAPICLFFIATISVPKLSMGSSYRDLHFALVGYIMESINASFNIFIYYNMSSRYRISFQRGLYAFRVRCRDKTFSQLEHG